MQYIFDNANLIFFTAMTYICMQDSSASMFDRPQDALAAGSGGGEPPVTPLPNVSTLVIKVHACMRGMFYMYMMHACFFLP